MLSTRSLFSSWHSWPVGKELPMPQPLTKYMVSGLDKQDTRKRIAKPCQDRDSWPWICLFMSLTPSS
ncbi:hypothetical protein LEMLEM_LOCUS17351, partial [Lemmus lemmus]